MAFGTLINMASRRELLSVPFSLPEPLEPEAELGNLKDLYVAGQFEELLRRATRSQQDSRYSACQPDILYIQWAAERKLGNGEDRDRLMNAFLTRCPTSTLAADMYFDQAIRLLGSGQFEGADEKLAIIVHAFPRCTSANRANEIRAYLASKNSVTSQ